MKKLLMIFAAVAVVGLASSCAKCGTCSSDNIKVCVGTGGWTDATFDSYKSSCTLAGYTWTDN